MGSYCRIVIHSPRLAIESTLLEVFDAESFVPVADAKKGDFYLSEVADAVALDENDAISFFQYVAHEPELLVDLSRRCNTKITAIAVQTGVVFVSILVADRGEIIRRYSECEGETEIDDGTLPDWDDQIRGNAWNAADDLVGILPWQPEPSVIGTALRNFGRSIGLISGHQPNETPRDTPSGLSFGEPVSAIPTERYYAKLNLKSTKCQIEGARLLCILEDGSELVVCRTEIEKPFSNPFTGEGAYLAFRDGRVMSLPDSVEFSSIDRWFQATEE